MKLKQWQNDELQVAIQTLITNKFHNTTLVQSIIFILPVLTLLLKGSHKAAKRPFMQLS